MEAIILSIFTFFSTLSGGFYGLKNKKYLHYIMSFTSGVLLAVCFFDILPEGLKIIMENKFDITPLLIAIVIGFLVIHILEKVAIIHTSHEEEYQEHTHPTVGKISASGLIFHSFLDGVGIGLGFQAGPHVGLLIALAVIAHDFSDGLNTVTLLLHSRNTDRKAVLFLIGDAIAPIAGVISTFFFSIPAYFLILYLGFFAGFLLYIGASDLLPEAHSKHSSFRMIGLTILGVVFIFTVTRFV
ncbi:MAG TPA: ZIP family metal transporter [Patescibacteria group bacterium]|nr:ZIP family metal transporter [Patescibacteria group bacterium]